MRSVAGSRSGAPSGRQGSTRGLRPRRAPSALATIDDRSSHTARFVATRDDLRRQRINARDEVLGCGELPTARGITEVCTARADAARVAWLTRGFKPFA
jgi:hypothetical protein